MGFFDKFKGNSDNFESLDYLIKHGQKNIVLDSNIVFGNDDESKYRGGLNLDIDNMVIDGNGHVIDAKGKARIFNVTGKNIELKNITLKNGVSRSINNEGSLTIKETILQKNQASGDGGVIWNKGEINILTARFDRNVAANGGCIFNEGNIKIDDTRFENNKSNNGGGVIDNDGEIKISKSVFDKNSAVHGGAINNRGKIMISSCEFNNNKVTDRGGAINNWASMSIRKSRFINNNANKIGGAISNGNLSYNMADGKYDPDIYIDNCFFERNKSTQDGGAICNRSKLKVQRSTFQLNRSEIGGAISTSEGLTTMRCVFTHNFPDDIF